MAQTSDAAGQSRLYYQISAGDLKTALQAFSENSGQAVIVGGVSLANQETRGLTGSHDADTALQLLLAGTGLVAQKNVQGQWVLRSAGLAAARSAAHDGVVVLPEVTVVGTGLETDLQAYPGSVSVLTQDNLQTSSTVIEALAGVPGVSTGGDSGRGSGQQFNIRGFGYQSEDRVIILQDGVRRSASLYSNHISTFRSDNDLLKRVEVVKGASSVQHGGGAIGGVVAMTNKDASDFVPTGKDAGFAAKLRYEHNNYREGYLAAALAPKEQPYELLVYGKKGTRGDLTSARVFMQDANGNDVDTVDNDEDLRVLFLQGGFRFTPEQKLSLSYYDFSQDNETTWQTLYHPSVSTVTGPVTGKLKQQDLVAKYTYSSLSNPLIHVSAQAYHSKSSYDRGYEYVNANTGAPTDLDYENADKRSGLRLSNEALFDTGAVSHRLVTGLDYEKRKEDATYLLNGEYSDFGSMPNTYKDFGLYGHLESSFFNNALVLQLGGRYDRFDRRVDANDGSYKDNNFSPRLGASLRVFEGFNLLGNWSEAFRAPTPHETSSQGPLNPHYWYLPNPDLKPETIRETELGFSYTKPGLFAHGDAFKIKFMFFRGRLKDMIVFSETRTNELSPQGSPYGMYQNISRAKRHGFEWEASYDRPLAGVGVGYSRLKQTNEETGRNVPQGFADKLSLNVYVRPVDGLKLGATVNHWFKPDQNPQSTVSGGTTYWYVRDDYTIVDFSGSWSPNPRGSGFFGRDFEVQFGINNVFDQPYLNARDVESTSRVGKGRNVFVSLASRF